MIPFPGAHHESFPDVEARFDTDAIRPGWEKDTGVVVASITKDGVPIELAPRSILERVIGEWRSAGFNPMVGFELEAFLFEPDGDQGWNPIHTPGSYVYGTGTAVDPSGTIEEIMQTAHEMGIELESVNSEYDDGQFELTLRYGEALKAADDAFLFKVMAREVAAKRGYLLAFMGKPITDRGGSGIHVNFSLVDDQGENAPRRPVCARRSQRPGPPLHRRHRPRSRLDDGVGGADRQRLQAAAARLAQWLLRQLGL